MSVLNKTRERNTTRIATHEGGEGRKAEVREELAMLALSSFLGNSFYETSNDTLARMQRLVAKAPKTFVTQLARVARQEFNMRATPAALIGFYTLEHGQPQDGRVIRDVFTRGDELGDYLGTVSAFSEKRKVIPSAVRFSRAVLQANLNERTALRYSNFNRDWNLAKIIRIAHARAEATEAQRALFDFILLWKSEGSMTAAWEKLPEEARKHLPLVADAAQGNDTAGEISWERARSRGDSWESIVGNMGYMALLRNLRNFMQDDGLSNNREFWKLVLGRLSDEKQVARSKQLPFRFLSAYRAISPANRGWYYEDSPSFKNHPQYHAVLAAISEALDHSVGNLPSLGDNNLVLVDTSASMDATVSDKSGVSYVEIGTLFGAALSKAGNGTTVCFGTKASRVPVNPSESILSIQGRLVAPALRSRLGFGTNMSTAFAQVNVHDYDTIAVFSDMQIHDQIRTALRGYNGRLYSVNLASYEAQLQKAAPNQYVMGGWSDASLKMMSVLAQQSLVSFIENYE